MYIVDIRFNSNIYYIHNIFEKLSLMILIAHSDVEASQNEKTYIFFFWPHSNHHF